MLIGKNITGAAFFSGLIDEVAVYPYALTAARVLAHYNAGWDFTLSRVASVQDARLNTVASFAYNDDLATTQVIDGRGLPAYYTFQQYGGRTLSVTDTGNNLTTYQYDGGASYRLIATVSPSGIRHSRLMNSGAPVGQQDQVLLEDDSSQPGSTSQFLMNGVYPDPSIYGSSTLNTAPESWIWDSALSVQPGINSHRSTPGAGAHQHYLTFSNAILIPAGSSLTQWVYLEPGLQAPAELELQLQANDSTGWNHRVVWGPYALFPWGGGFGCPANCQQSSALPVTGRWAQLNISLGPTEGATPALDVDMAGRLMNGIAFTLYGGGGAVWWGPTMFRFPGASATDPLRTVTRAAYNSTNDVVASVDANGIASIRDIDASGLTRAASTGVEPAAPINLFQDNVSTMGTSAWQQEFGYAGTSALAVTSPQHNGVGSLTQTHTAGGLQSDLYKDVTGLSPGTYVRVSVWVQTSVGATGTGGALLMVENHLALALNVQRRSGSIQTAGQWMQLSLPFVVDGSGQLRLHLWQENLQGTTTWADMRIDDLTPAPDGTLQHSLASYTTNFEADSSTWTLGTAAALQDATQAHTGQYSIKDTLGASNTSNTASRTLSLPTNATYRISAWVRTVQSGGNGGIGGAQLCAQFSTLVCYPTTSTYLTTEGQWQQLTISVLGSGTLTVQLKHVNWQGDVYWDDVNVERVADGSPASTGLWQGTAWAGTVTSPAAATWASSWSAGVGGGPSRQVTITSSSALTDVRDALPISVLRTGASYLISVWASSSLANTNIDFSLRDATFNALPMDSSTTCVLQTIPTLCENSITYAGGDRASNNLVIYYGAQGARTVTISHPLVALANQLFDYTAYGQVSRRRDIFGHSTSITFDASSLYPTQTVVTATPSPNLTTNYTYNSIGQLIVRTRVNAPQTIAEQLWLDSFGRMVGDVKNCVVAVAPPSLCNATANSSTNVMTRYVYDLNGNLADRYDQALVSGNWIDTHYLYDGDNNQIARIQSCVTVTNPCDGTSNATQNVVFAFAYDALNHLMDTYAPTPGCTANCVPAPVCAASPPPTCTPAVTPCPATTCVDGHAVYDTTGRIAQQIANYGGTQDASQANVTTTFAYDADGRVVDVFRPITSAVLQTGWIDEHRAYDALGRLVTDIGAYGIPSWMVATTQARIDYTLDAGGRVISVTGPGTGSTSATNRIVTTTDYDDLDRPLSVTADSGTGGGHLNAVTKKVYDPRGAVRTWTPATQQLVVGLQTSANYDLAMQQTSVVKDNGAGGLRLATSTTYDAYGRATDVVDPRGIDTNTAYDALDRPTSVTQNYCPTGSTNPNCNGSGILPDQNLATSYVYDLAGNQTQVINPRSIIQYTGYDALARPLLVTKNCQTVPTPPSTSCGTQSSDQNVTSSLTYDQFGDILSSTDPLARVNVLAYDALGRRVSKTDNCVGTGGQCNGGVTSGQNLVTTWQVDAQGEVLQERSPRQCTSAAPCYQGATGSSLTDGANLTTGYIYDGLLRLASVIEDQSTASGHLNFVTSYTYDPSGNKLTQIDGRANTTTYTVDNLGRVAKVTDANSNLVQTNYSLAGEVVSTINARGKTNLNTLDRLGRVTGVSYFKADGVTALTQSFGYDADSNRTSFSDTDVAQTTVSYDHLNRVSTVTAPSPLGTTSSAYFLDGALNTVTDATGTTTFTEDHIGRVATMVDPLNPTGSNTTTYSFDAAARLTGRTEANTIVTTAGYSGADQLASKTEVAGSTTLASWSAVTYDLAQNRTGETLTYYASNPYPDPQAGSATYKYDSVNQLSQSSIPGQSAAAFGFDAAHNLTSNAGNRQAYNNNESLQTVAAATVGSDADGNQQKDVVGNILSWNSLSQFEQFSTTETYAYDALGRLTKVSNGSNVTQFVYRGLSGQVVEELNGSGGVIRSYAWDTLGRQLYVKAGTTVYYEITDPHGDVAALASGTALVGTAHFDPWGNRFTPNGTITPFGFQGAAGSWSDATSGFVSMGVRWYYPKVGRFLSRDPAAGTANPRVPLTGLRWLYGLNSPLIHSDPTGLDTQLDNSGGCDAACQGAAAPPAAAPPPAQQAATQVCGRGGCVPTQNPVDWCNLGGLHWCAAGNALGNQQVSVDQYQANEIAAGIQDSIMGMGRTGQAVANCQHGDWSACQVLGSGVAHTVMHPGGLIDYEDLSNGRYGRWVGHIIPAILMAGVTVGAGGLLAGGTAAATEATSADLATATAEASASEVAGAAPKLLTGGGVNSWEGGITSTITDSPTTMWRVWGGGSGRTGQWLSTVKPTNAFEAQEGLALPPGNTATFLSQVVVPAGVRIQIGQAAGIWGRAGGWEQVQLLDKIPAGSFGEGSVLTPLLEAAFP